jgi:hypothetical protein
MLLGLDRRHHPKGYGLFKRDGKPELAVRCEYACSARPNLLLEVPVRQFRVNATPYDTGWAFGTVQPQPDHDDFGRPAATRPGGILVGLKG